MARLGQNADGQPAPGKRIAVIGTSGSGKTYVGRTLAGKLGLTYVCNDALIWRPDWQPASEEERLAGTDEATAGDAWTFDGNLGSRPEDQLVLARCDTLVWLDLPRRSVHWQVIVRTLQRLLTRERLWHDNVERWSMLFSSDSIVWWSIKTFARRRREYAALFADPEMAGKTLIRIGSRREVDRWLAALPAITEKAAAR